MLAHRIMTLVPTHGRDPRPWYFPQVLGITKRWMADVRHLPRRHVPRPAAARGERRRGRPPHPARVHRPSRRATGSRRSCRCSGRATGPGRPTAWTSSPPRRSSRPAEQVPRELRRPRRDRREPVGEGGRGDLRDAAEVAAYVKNDRLGFTIPYTMRGPQPRVHPRLPGQAQATRRRRPCGRWSSRCPGREEAEAPTKEKAETARNLWVPAVNNHGGFGRWGVRRDRATPRRSAPTWRSAIEALLPGTRPSSPAKERAAMPPRRRSRPGPSPSRRSSTTTSASTSPPPTPVS